MGILEKVRDFFYDEEDEDIQNEVKKIKPKKEKTPKVKEIKFEKPKKEKQEISERELFKAERTFNFPMDIEDEYTVKEEPKKEKIEIKKPIIHEEPKKVERPVRVPSYTTTVQKQKEEEKKFKPTPVISPIYGILDKNYKKEDVLIDSTIEKSETKKLDYETVRKRAYSKSYADVSEDKTQKDIFYNLDKDEEKKEDEVKIVYNDVTFEDKEEEEEDKNITIGEKIEKYEKKLEEEQSDDDTNILSETKEQDLFNLIDNMYNSDDDEDDEEE